MITSSLKTSILVLAFAIVLAACSNAATNQAPLAPTVPPTAAPPQPSITLQPCMVGNFSAQCGTLKVYEDRAARSGRMIDLRVAVIKAKNPKPAPDPIFWLAGGPGAAATEDTGYALQVLGPANEQRDLVFVDQRGTGGSNKLVCPQSTDPARQVENLRACLAGLNGDPSAYTTAWAMDDVDDVRTALGYDQINLYGESYGATAEQVYMLRHSEHVRTSALAGGSLLDVPMFERYPISSQKALEFLFARCNADAACHAAFPNLRQEFAGALARLDRAPVTLPITDPATGQPVVATSENFKNVVHNALASTPMAVMVPQLTHLVYTEDWKGLAAFLAPFASAASATPQWKMMNLTILCHEDWAKLRPAETVPTSNGSYLKYADVRALTVPEDICAVVPPPKAESLYGPVTSSTVPVLFFNGEADPQDPPENVAAAKQRYPNSLSLVAPGQAHGYTGIPCRASIVADFIGRGSVEGLSTECLQQVKLPDFAK
jgi:pimeloyl-ACP methyl ester carboxylesterase